MTSNIHSDLVNGESEEFLDSEKRQVRSSTITNITIERLFGKYSYTLPDYALSSLPGEYNRLILLYGDNGSGKTTILKLIYHMLSPATSKGHRSFIAKTPFQKLTINFANDVSVIASKSEGQLVGSFIITILRNGTLLQNFVMEANEEMSIPSPKTPEETRTNERLRRALANLNIRPYYLADDRNFYSDAFIDEDEQDLLVNYSRHFIALNDQFLDKAPRRIQEDRELLHAITRAKEWLRQQAFRGTNTGSASANALYLDVIRHLAISSGLPQKKRVVADGKSVTQRLKELEKRTAAYEEFGLSTPLFGGEFLNILTNASPDRKELLEEVLVPYLEGIQARLDALKDLYDLLVAFTSAVNSFFSDKKIRLDLREGITIFTSDGNELPPSSLSSGERQLLLLLCNTLVARDGTRLFIIDEPEISLNVKWQRQLLDALLACTSGTDVQFLVATHSIEMVAGHRESLAKLVEERAKQSR